MVKKKTDKVSSSKDEQRANESSNFVRIYTQYTSSIDAIREFFLNLRPVVLEIEEDMENKERTYIRELFENFSKKASAEETEEMDNFFEFVKKSFEGKVSEKAVKYSFISKSPLVDDCIMRLLRAGLSHSVGGTHRELLNRSILMSLVSYFEVLIADLAHAFYRIAPNAISTDDKVLSVNELKRFSSIDEALRSIVSDRIDRLLRESVNDWQDFFQSRLKIDMKSLIPNWAYFNEYFQRRHVVVHAGGCATERYLSNVDWEELKPNITKPSIGDKLNIENTYIDSAIDSFEILGLLLCQEIWKKLVPNDKSRYHNAITDTGLLDAVYKRLLSRHWYVAERLTVWGENDSEASEDIMLVCKFNRWLCTKRQGRWAEVEEEVKAFDISAKNRKYALVKASLLEEIDRFYSLLPSVLSSGDIDAEALREWPILEEVRSDSRFAEFISESNKE